MDDARPPRASRQRWALGALVLCAVAGWLSANVPPCDGEVGKLDGLVNLLTLRFVWTGTGTLLKGLGIFAMWLAALAVAGVAIFGKFD